MIEAETRKIEADAKDGIYVSIPSRAATALRPIFGHSFKAQTRSFNPFQGSYCFETPGLPMSGLPTTSPGLSEHRQGLPLYEALYSLHTGVSKSLTAAESMPSYLRASPGVGMIAAMLA
jgi:hypothetical protein